jgi:archaellum component FlaC
MAPLVEKEDSHYSEHSDNGEELKEAYKTLYVEYEKLREGRKQNIHDLNSLQTEKSSLLRKIQELEEKLLETQLQLERVTDEKADSHDIYPEESYRQDWSRVCSSSL